VTELIPDSPPSHSGAHFALGGLARTLIAKAQSADEVVLSYLAFWVALTRGHAIALLVYFP